MSDDDARVFHVLLWLSSWAVHGGLAAAARTSTVRIVRMFFSPERTGRPNTLAPNSDDLHDLDQRNKDTMNQRELGRVVHKLFGLPSRPANAFSN